ncbi:MAG: hypothetical protein ACRELT_02085 [Longimicrobiales bacterium]
MIHFPMPVVDIELLLGAEAVYTFGAGDRAARRRGIWMPVPWECR